MLLCVVESTAGNCDDGDVRLSEGAVDDIALTMDGRLEICFNNAWGTVCNNSFRAADVKVACNQLPGFNKEGGLCPKLKCSYFQRVFFFPRW